MDLPITGEDALDLWLPLIVGGLVVTVGVLIPFAWFVVEFLVALCASGVLIVGRWLRHRSWRVSACSGSVRREFEVDTWSDARRARRELVESIRVSGSPATATGRQLEAQAT